MTARRFRPLDRLLCTFGLRECARSRRFRQAREEPQASAKGV